jgi:hypothetical protein
MPIAGLTDRAASFPQIGALRKGAPKPEAGNRPGKDLEYFRFDSDDAQATADFQAAYGDTPASIRVYLPYSTTVENFEAWQEAWTAGALQHRCDGQTCVRWLNGKSYSTEPRACPGGCKPAGRLKVIIPELRRLAYVMVLTTSIHDIMTIQANLEALEVLRGSLRGIPLILARGPREISTPDDRSGKRVRREKWLITIEAAPSWVDLQLTAMERAALPLPVKMLGAGMVDTQTGEIIDTHNAEPDADDDRTAEAEHTDQQAERDQPAPSADGKRERMLARISKLTAQADQLDLDITLLKPLDQMTGPELIAHGKNLVTAIEQAKQPGRVPSEPLPQATTA